LILNRLFIEGTESLYPQQTVYRGDWVIISSTDCL
jgi:hypothetical protein